MPGRRERLDESEIARGLEGSEWAREGDAILRTFRFAGFREALAFVNAVGELAEERDHHPDIDIRWNRVRLRLSTHSAGGLTPMDFELAQAIDGVEVTERR
jgi:4a-hydroxytetrahydrobiopterin dehydratase